MELVRSEGLPPPSSLSRLMKRIQDREEAAFQELFDRTRGRVFGLLRCLLGERPEAEEVLVEAFVQVWREAARYDPERGSPEVWLFCIARNLAIDRLRRKGISDRPVQLDELSELASGGPTPLQSTQNQERSTLVRHAIRALPNEQRRAIVAAYFQGLSYSEAAKALGEPVGTVKSRIRSGLSALRTSLGRTDREASED